MTDENVKKIWKEWWQIYNTKGEPYAEVFIKEKTVIDTLGYSFVLDAVNSLIKNGV